MAIRIYSDKTQKFYNSIEEANKAEVEVQEAENRERIRKEQELAAAKEKKEKENAERKAAAAELDEARKAMNAAQKHYAELLDAFIKKYKSYHFSSTSLDEFPVLFNLFDTFNL